MISLDQTIAGMAGILGCPAGAVLEIGEESRIE